MNKHQPKSLTELARKAINKNIKSVPHLRDFALPPRLIRDLEEMFAEDRHDYEQMAALRRYTECDFCEFFL